jgi:hypothetical protein
MKKLYILLFSFALTTSVCAQKRNTRYDINTGTLITGAGVIFSVVALAVPDGSHWTYSHPISGPNYSQARRVDVPFHRQSSRVVMLGVGGHAFG